MADDMQIEVPATLQIAPPPATVGDRSLPLTFFDILWLPFFPINQLFFFEFHQQTDYNNPEELFAFEIFPKLKHSLSITLQHFFPFASNLIVFPKQNDSNVLKKPEIRYVEGDSVTLTYARSTLSLSDLAGNHPRASKAFYGLVPRLGRAKKVSNDEVAIPLFAVQITYFANQGFSLGLTNHHTLSDASTRFDFMKAWTSIAKNGTDELFLSSESKPFYDRAIVYPDLLDEIFMNQPGIEKLDGEHQPAHPSSDTDKVRATVIMEKTKINELKKWLLVKLPNLEYLSSFSITCAYIWSCIAKSRDLAGELIKGDNDLERFICTVDWRSRLTPPIPKTYFGNCVGLCDTAKIESKKMSGDAGFINATELLGQALSRTLKNKDGMFKDAEMWLVRACDPAPVIGVAGSPKIKVYDLDFGWGKPSKYETISIDYNGSISVNACKEAPDDIEVGLCLSPKHMDAFVAIFTSELDKILKKE
ncbi:malonyl-coenzyme A:anthocyanin 3-O-glucoside-6''-O-malonyltransferase-like [Rutidosis leptorrhynchoides]|uniref:malonyl-coenzyme A:anthocyanin 3-O-glucoside-6''-O-malonyltransferase-like n=1 Tax=Rutidosis leptorrhynchoides TaxID=125765 RepID=UPI003A9A4F54